jgi:hypothetical protein
MFILAATPIGTRYETIKFHCLGFVFYIIRLYLSETNQISTLMLRFKPGSKKNFIVYWA